jgi:hypothetical protein
MRAVIVFFAICFSSCALGDELTFTAVDVYVQTSEPLAAWQFRLDERNGTMQVVGVENGDSPAYTRTPYYDREAVNLGQADRIVVADYSLASDNELPSGKIRVATLHLMLSGTDKPDYDISLIAAARPDGQHLDATISIEPTARKEL